MTSTRLAAALASLLLTAPALAQGNAGEDLVPPGPAPTPIAPPPPSSPFGAFAPSVSYAPPLPPVYRHGMSGVEIASLYSTAVVYGAGLGLWLADTAIRDDSGAHTVILPLLGIGAGVAAAVFIDRDAQVRRGRALAVHAGMWLGLTAGAGVVGVTNASFDRDEQNLGQHALFLSATGGMILGAGLAAATDARPGSVSLTFSAGFWGAYAGAMTESIARGRRSRFPAAGILIGEGIGVAAGMILSNFVEPTAAQARWMDLGAISGASVGALLGGLVRNSDIAPFLGSLLGMSGGLALGYALGRPTPADRQMNRERDGVAFRPSAFVMPVEGGAVAGLSL